MAFVRWCAVMMVGVLAGLSLPTGSVGATENPEQTVAPRAAAGVEDPNTHTDIPKTGLFWNDPKGADSATDPRDHARQVMYDRFNDADARSTVRIMMYSVWDDKLTDAIRDAYGFPTYVDFRVLVSRDRCDDAREKLGFLTRPGSSFDCVAGHGMHQKSITFSSADGVPNVTLVGSSNMHSSSWQDQWNDLFQFANRADVYDWYVDRFDQVRSNLGNPDGVPYVNHVASDGRARVDFLPIRPNVPDSDVVATNDPMWKRLDELPAGSGTTATQIRVAMWAMDETRGEWLADKLRQLSRNGAVIKVIAGPPARDYLKAEMVDDGIKVVNGYERLPVVCRGATATDTCNFVHLKMMTAKYWANGIWNYRVWTGSDNWNLDSLLHNFEASQRLGGEGTWDSYQQLFNAMWTRYSDEWPCAPLCRS